MPLWHRSNPQKGQQGWSGAGSKQVRKSKMSFLRVGAEAAVGGGDETRKHCRQRSSFQMHL